MKQTRYYQYDGIPCRLTTENDGTKLSAEGYFPGKGFRPVTVTDVLFKGTIITREEFMSLVVAQTGRKTLFHT